MNKTTEDAQNKSSSSARCGDEDRIWAFQMFWAHKKKWVTDLSRLQSLLPTNSKAVLSQFYLLHPNSSWEKKPNVFTPMSFVVGPSHRTTTEWFQTACPDRHDAAALSDRAPRQTALMDLIWSSEMTALITKQEVCVCACVKLSVCVCVFARCDVRENSRGSKQRGGPCAQWESLQDAVSVSLFSTNSWFQAKGLYLWKENGGRGRKGIKRKRRGRPLSTVWTKSRPLNQVPCCAQNDQTPVTS